MFCLPKSIAEKLKQAIKKGEFKPDKIFELKSSQEARDYFAKFIGEENAKEVNLLYEKKLLLKNQENAIMNFYRQVMGDKEFIKQKEKLVEQTKTRIEQRKEKIYNPAENEKMFNEIASDAYFKKYKTEVSLEQAQTITELAQDMRVAKEKLIQSGESGFGVAKRALDNYVNALRINAIKKGFINPLTEIGFSGKARSIVENAKISVNFIAENSKAIAASLDNSFWFRQGIRALLDPRYTKVWINDFAKSWTDIFRIIKGNLGGGAGLKGLFLGKDAVRVGDAITDGVLAKIYEEPDYLNGRFDGKVGKGTAGTKLDINTGEEAYPTSAPSKIPVLGRLFKASEVVYEAGAMRLRVNIAKQAYKWAEKAGYDMTDNQVIGEINRTVNQITGRATFGKRAGGFERGVNVAIFSIKFFKSNVDYLTAPVRYLLDTDSAGKKMAATNLLYTASMTAIIMKLAQTLNSDDNKEIFNPIATNFCKIKQGNMTFDLSHGACGIIVAVSRVAAGKSTSGQGITRELNSGYGSQTSMDIFYNFMEGKSSPMFRVLIDLANRGDFQGKKITALGEVSKVAPITTQNVVQFKGEPTPMYVLGLIADGLGINTNVYTPSPADWGESTGKELQQFKTKIGDVKFKEANDKFNQQYSEWLKSVSKNDKYNNLSGEDKQKVITKKKSEIKDKIFKQYGGFKYKQEKSKQLPKF